MSEHHFEFLVIGSGAAGLTSALTLSKKGRVLLVSKGAFGDGSSLYAQGGICVSREADEVQSHIEDTLAAGAEHNDRSAVSVMVESSAEAIDWLEHQGVRFDREPDGAYSQGLEAAHSRPRILHATDFTGRSIQVALVSQARRTPGVTIWDEATALDLIVRDGQCFGAYVLRGGIAHRCFADATVLATGGLGQVYRWTTNPAVSSGDGIALGMRAGAEVADLEFIQFHPTALRADSSPAFLISEAVRGAGAYIVNQSGQRFLFDVDPRGELAPRDIVARAIYDELPVSEVYIDCRHLGLTPLLKRFPNIYQGALDRGFNLATDLVPVTPAAHYSCGGLKVDLDGSTSIAGLFACGEVARTGVHGANRLASNSLLEAVVFARSLMKKPLPKTSRPVSTSCPEYCKATPERFAGLKRRLQHLMWEKVGIVRAEHELRAARAQIEDWSSGITGAGWINEDIAELRNMLLVSAAITQAALNRRVSLGSHFLVTSPRVDATYCGHVETQLAGADENVAFV